MLDTRETQRLAEWFRAPRPQRRMAHFSIWREGSAGNLCPDPGVFMWRSISPGMRKGNATMLYWALVFLLISLVAALFGFSGIAAVFGGFAQLLFYIFIALFLVTLILHLVRGRGPPPVA
jgi:uncharacterized membrane protein YtjA (UPF0391 family)